MTDPYAFNAGREGEGSLALLRKRETSPDCFLDLRVSAFPIVDSALFAHRLSH